VRKTNKINRALNIVEDKKKLEEEVKRLQKQIEELNATISQRDQTVTELNEEKENLGAELTATNDTLNSVRAAKKKVLIPPLNLQKKTKRRLIYSYE